jgi:hypothetical protein
VPPEAPRIVTAVTDAAGGYSALVPVGYYQTVVDAQRFGHLHLTTSPIQAMS